MTNSHAPLQNRDGDTGNAFAWDFTAATDPLNTAADRALATLPMSADELEAWSTAADDYTGPRLIALPGFDYTKSIAGLPHYYWGEDGRWRDTLTDEIRP